MTTKEAVLAVYPDARVCEGDAPGSRIIMRPGQILSDEIPARSWDEDGATIEAWNNAQAKLEANKEARQSATVPSVGQLKRTYDHAYAVEEKRGVEYGGEGWDYDDAEAAGWNAVHALIQSVSQEPFGWVWTYMGDTHFAKKRPEWADNPGVTVEVHPVYLQQSAVPPPADGGPAVQLVNQEAIEAEVIACFEAWDGAWKVRNLSSLKDTLVRGLSQWLGSITPPADGGWVAVTERLPEEDGAYIALSDTGIVFPMLFMPSYGKWATWTADGLVTFDNVTHWQPLPPPPADKGKWE